MKPKTKSYENEHIGEIVEDLQLYIIQKTKIEDTF